MEERKEQRDTGDQPIRSQPGRKDVGTDLEKNRAKSESGQTTFAPPTDVMAKQNQPNDQNENTQAGASGSKKMDAREDSDISTEDVGQATVEGMGQENETEEE